MLAQSCELVARKSDQLSQNAVSNIIYLKTLTEYQVVERRVLDFLGGELYVILVFILSLASSYIIYIVKIVIHQQPDLGTWFTCIK